MFAHHEKALSDALERILSYDSNPKDRPSISAILEHAFEHVRDSSHSSDIFAMVLKKKLLEFAV